MQWMLWIGQRRRVAETLAAAAHQLATSCQATVWSRVQGAIAELGFHEARGYVQARGALIIRCRARELAAAYPQLTAVQWSRVRDLASDRLVTWSVSEAARLRSAERRAAMQTRRAA